MSDKLNKDPIAYVVSMGKGLESFIYTEIDYLTKRGMRLVLFATKFKKNDIFSPKADWEYYRVKAGLKLFLTLIKFILSPLTNTSLFIEVVKFRGFIEFFFALYYAPTMKRLGIKRIHAHFGDRKLFVAYYCKKLTGAQLSVTIHSHELHWNPNTALFIHSLQYCDSIVTISDFAKKLLVERYGANQNIITVNHLFVDTDVFEPKQTIKVLTVARFEPQKGLNYLLDAAESLKDKDIEFIVVGWGPMDVAGMIKERGLEDKVTLFSKLSAQQLRHLYQASDIYCLSSIDHPTQGKEGIPVVLMEAMACGLPVVATDPGAVNEIVDQTLIPEKDPAAIAEAISALANDRERREAEGKANREKVLKEFSPDNISNLEEFLNG